jgi:hypothetical protein
LGVAGEIKTTKENIQDWPELDEGDPLTEEEIAVVILFSSALPIYLGARGSIVVKALCYKPEGRGFDSR